jgi:hypothetical protein
MHKHRILLLACVSLFFFSAVPVSACSELLGYRDVTFYTSQIKVSTSNFSDTGAISSAANFWDTGCSGSNAGYQFPEISSGVCSQTDCIEVYVNYVGGVSTSVTGGCAEYQDHQVGQTNGGTIKVFATSTNGFDCSGDWLYALEHELGHVLGLDHPTPPSGDLGHPCFGSVMGSHYYGYPASPLDTEDCNNTDHQWYTPTEEHRDDEQTLLQDCESRCASHCEEDYGGSFYCPVEGQSPIIFDLDDNGFNLTDADRGVDFDLNADHQRERVAWTTTAGTNAWLCRDRNGDGVIGDGRELFGNSTPLANGHKAPNGFVALAEFDAPASGGNADGQLDSRDRLWGTLLLWIDANHDGHSQPGELMTLAEAGVQSIDLHYIRSNYTDDNGNIFRFRAKAVVRDRKGKFHNAKIYDVFLSTVSAGGSGVATNVRPHSAGVTNGPQRGGGAGSARRR